MRCRSSRISQATTTTTYTLSLHDALPISRPCISSSTGCATITRPCRKPARSEEHTSELQSPDQLVCRLVIEKKEFTSAKATLNRMAHTLALDGMVHAIKDPHTIDAMQGVA